MITFPISEIMKLHEESYLHAIAGIGAFVASTMGSMLLKCLIAKRRQRKKDEKFMNEMKATKDVMTIANPKGDSVNSGEVLEV